MPTYVYETMPTDGSAPRRFEVSQRMSEPALRTDPATGEPVQRVISGGMGFIAGRDERGMIGDAGGGGMPAAMRNDSHSCGPGCGH